MGKRAKTIFKITAELVIYHDIRAPKEFVAEIAKRDWQTHGLWGCHVEHGSYGIDKPAKLVSVRKACV